MPLIKMIPIVLAIGLLVFITLIGDPNQFGYAALNFFSVVFFHVVLNRICSANVISNFEVGSRGEAHVFSYPVYATATLAYAAIILAIFASDFGWVAACLTAVNLLNVAGQLIRAKVRLSKGVSSQISYARTQLEKTNKPKFAFYFSHGDLNHPLHYLVWKKYMDELGEPYVIILREKKHLGFFQGEGRDVPTILHVATVNLKNAVPSTVTTIFYANNGFKNIEMINAMPHLRHVQLLHGDSDKPSSYNPAVRCYSDLFVSGQMAVDRYTNHGVYLEREKTHIVGRPQVSDITVVDAPQAKPVVTIAYMPTWFGYFEETQLSSLSIAGSMFEKILNHDFGDQKVHIIFKAHPMTYKDPGSQKFLAEINEAIRKATRNSAEVLDETTDAITVFNKADILLTDISSVVIDFLYSKKPYLISNTNDFNLQDLTKYPCVKGGYLLTPDASNINELLTEAMTSDSLRETRMELRKYAFGDTHMKPGQLFRETCLGIINR